MPTFLPSRSRLIVRVFRLSWGLLLAAGVARGAAESDPLVNPAHGIALAAPDWSALIASFTHNPDIAADFTERRFFPFKKDSVELKGEVRVSVTRGLSLH